MRCYIYKWRLSVCLFVVLFTALLFITYLNHSELESAEKSSGKRKTRHRKRTRSRKQHESHFQKARLQERELVLRSTAPPTLRREVQAHRLGQIRGKNTDQGITGKFTEIAKDTHIYSAFYDDAKSNPFIRLIILSGKHYQPGLSCQFCEPLSASCSFADSKAEYYTTNENHGRVFGGFIASCLVPDGFNAVPLFVDLTADVKGEKSKARVPVVSNAHLYYPIKYAICVPPLRSEKLTAKRLIEFVELTKLLGANHFTFYDFKTDPEVNNVLRYYQESQVANVLPWNLPSNLVSRPNDIWYFGQVLAILDCLYRYKNRAKFVAFNDVDEFIVPLRNSSIVEILNAFHRPYHCGHCFQSVVFSSNARFPRQKSELVSQRFFHRTQETIPLLSKCIVDPLRVFEMGIHHISKATGLRYSVNSVHESDAVIFHYRTCTTSFGIRHQCMNLVHDGTMAKYGKRLQKRFRKVVNDLKLLAPT
ncbi:beta-1,4-galactosyltransferase galt-1 [Nematostella vectensis]|uniref:beta-1,4-galactosyltransferase galt-1 n=1 Tax=Nematostella vectensis TaxID=45351 RepID=UPI0020777F69|nr:beta-1,4-galactosyltransferase galt-1 [Nematostella vectensis]